MQHLQVPLNVCLTCWPDTSGNKTTRAPTLLVGVCVCVSVIYWSICCWVCECWPVWVGLKYLVMYDMLHVWEFIVCPPPTLITSCTLSPHHVNHLFVVSSMWVAWPWIRVCRFIYWKLLSLQIPYRGSARTKTSITHSYHTLAQEMQSLSWDSCDTWCSATSVLC